jgi:hypothetical protein
MGKIGRNDLCPCGSGKKYKKCCLGKIDASASLTQSSAIPKPSVTPVFADQKGTSTPWKMDQVENLSTRKIVQMLTAFGVDYDPDRFVEEINQFGSSGGVATHWEKIHPMTAEGFDTDFIWLAARVLRDRLAPDLIVTEALDDQMQEGYKLMEDRKYAEGCSLWLEVWEHLKKRFTPDMKSINDAEIVFEGMQSLHNWCQDMEMELGNAGQKDDAFTRKRIAYCREFYQLFPESSVLIIQNMRRVEAESHFDLGECEQGEARFKALIQDYPHSAWGYIGWADMYCLFRPNEQVPLDYDKAEQIYRMALEKGVTKDRDEVLERLEDLRAERDEQAKENE